MDVRVAKKAGGYRLRKAVRYGYKFAAGLIVFVVLPEMARSLNGGAFGQPSTVPQTQPEVPPAGSSGNYSIGQQGGFVNQTYNNNIFEAPPKIAFNDRMKAALLSQVPKDKPLEIQAVGSSEDINVGRQAAEFLTQNGYNVHLTTIGMLLPPPEKPLTLSTAGPTNVLTIAPSVR